MLDVNLTVGHVWAYIDRNINVFNYHSYHHNEPPFIGLFDFIELIFYLSPLGSIVVNEHSLVI